MSTNFFTTGMTALRPVSQSDPASRFERLLAQYASLLRSVVARHCPSSLGIQTSDIEQEARLRLWRTVEREKELTDPASYIYRIAVTTTIDAIRRVRARREEPLTRGHDDDEPDGEQPEMTADPTASPHAVAERRELMEKVQAALASMQENRRRTVELHLQGLSLEEIAHLLDWSEPKVRNLVYRGLGDLREALRREGIDYA